MRRTKATLIYRRTTNLRAVQLLLGHSKLESTVRYLGIEALPPVDGSFMDALRTHGPGQEVPPPTGGSAASRICSAPSLLRGQAINSVSGLPPRTLASTRKASRAPTCAPGERPVAQYDVYANPSTSAATGIPYVVVIQSDLLDALSTVDAGHLGQNPSIHSGAALKKQGRSSALFSFPLHSDSTKIVNSITSLRVLISPRLGSSFFSGFCVVRLLHRCQWSGS